MSDGGRLMGDERSVVPLGDLAGRSILSRTSGNKLGKVVDVFVDDKTGGFRGVTVDLEGEKTGVLLQENIYSFGSDAVMAERDDAVLIGDDERNATLPLVREHLIGIDVITESGVLIGRVSDVFLTLAATPLIVYEIHDSFWDKLLGRKVYILSSESQALSADRKRLVVSDLAAQTAGPDIQYLIDQNFSIRSLSSETPGDDRTVIKLREPVEDETLVRLPDDDKTILRRRPAA
ncbi:MAG: PRC-barrel domain-containing protein [Acidobacteria bacterium]|nr:PRC-barrel domain-containing protein [Acidobacteriota bacterium]